MTVTVMNHAPIHAIVPLALLEAIRNLDTPLDDGLADHATLVEGSWARPRGQSAQGGPTETTLARAAAAVLDIAVGDRVPVTNRRTGNRPVPEPHHAAQRHNGRP